MNTTREGVGVVLLAEDKDGARARARAFLEGEGYAVLAARDGAEALSFAAACPVPIDLLVAGASMPGMSGPELARRVAALHPEVKVLLTYDGPADAPAGPHAAKSGARRLGKPFTKDALADAARDALEGDRGAGADPPACIA